MPEMQDGINPILTAETYVFTEVAKMLRAKYPGIKVYGEEVDSPAGFPCVTIEESGNTSHLPTQTVNNVEHYANLMYTVNVYSNLPSDGKEQCKEILADVDLMMRNFGFLRTMNQPIPNFQKSIARRVARYTGILSENGLIYKR